MDTSFPFVGLTLYNSYLYLIIDINNIGVRIIVLHFLIYRAPLTVYRDHSVYRCLCEDPESRKRFLRGRRIQEEIQKAELTKEREEISNGIYISIYMYIIYTILYINFEIF